MPRTLLSNFKIGADPELFIEDNTGKFISAAGLIPGTKAEPFPVPGGAVQVDGMAAEFNINPATTFEEFDNNIVTVLAELKKFLPKGAKLRAVPSVVFDEDVWAAAPDEAKELGCSPDFNAWTEEVNMPPSCPENPRLRTASGHLHFGWTEGKTPGNIQHVRHCNDLVRQLDYVLGLWSLSQDPDPTRRLLYGKAGACRYKPYGVEYRVLSNFWVMTKAGRLQVWDRSCAALSMMKSTFFPKKFSHINNMVVGSINESTLHSKLTDFQPMLYS
jgi:hypothetical protein